VRKASELLLSRPGVDACRDIAVSTVRPFTDAPNYGVIFMHLEAVEDRFKPARDRKHLE